MKLGSVLFVFLFSAYAQASTNSVSQELSQVEGGKPAVTGSLSLNYEGLGQAEKSSGNGPAYSQTGGAASVSYQASEKHKYGVSASSSSLAFENVSQAYLPNQRFWVNSVGTSYGRKISERSSYDLSFSVSSSSDRYMAPSRDLSYGLSWVYNRSTTGLNRWTYGMALGYSANASPSVAIPIPFATYYYHYSETWQFNIGAPLSANLVLTDKLSFNAAYVPVKSVTFQGDYKLTKGNTLYLGYSLANTKSFRHAERANKKEGVFFEETKYFLGWATQAWSPASLNVSLAYVYNRDLWKSEKATDTGGKYGLPNEWRALTTASFAIL
jgi:hypothetical protein